MDMTEDLDLEEALDVLEISSSAELTGLARRYRRLARRHHPDAGGDPAAFQRLQAAYRTLCRTYGDGPPTRRMPGRGAHNHRARQRPRPDVAAVDWEADRGGVRRLSRSALAVRASRGHPVHPVVARSRGPRSLLNPLVPLLSPDLSSSLHIEPASPDDVDLRLTVRGGRPAARLLDVPLAAGWTRRRQNTVVTAERRLAGTGDPRADALAAAEEILAVLDALDWPARSWRITP